MHPILFKIGPLSIHSYGAMIALGFAITATMIYRTAPGFGIDRDKALDILILTLVSGIVGARALYVGLNFRYFLARPLEIPNLSMGGLAWYGAFVSAFICVVLYCRKQKIDLSSALDLGAPYIAMSQALGRIGCYLNGCCYGTGGFPVQLYSAAALFSIAAILWLVQKRRIFAAQTFLIYCVLYSIKRFAVEFLRSDNPKILAGLTLSQLIGIPIFAVSAYMLIKRYIHWKRNSSGSK
jgi:phosphatidylglycerol:prolipoprotein diacylglycerol transferase